MKIIRLLIFPLLQLVFLLLGMRMIYVESFVSGYLLILIAALFLNFSLHVSIHYHVHFKSRSSILNRITDVMASLLMGIPFHYYQMSHWNHHKHNNNLDDFTSTWRNANGIPVHRHFLIYSIFWPLISKLSLKQQLHKATTEGYFNQKKKGKMNIEGILILLFYCLLALYSLLFVGAYLTMIYIGWMFIAMHNYGQHLPENYGALNANSYYNAFYNMLSVNNGLHLEHHNHPQLKYWELSDLHQGTIHRPHLLEGFFFLLGRTRRRKV